MRSFLGLTTALTFLSTQAAAHGMAAHAAVPWYAIVTNLTKYEEILY